MTNVGNERMLQLSSCKKHLSSFHKRSVLDEEQARNLRACEEMLSELKAKYMGMWIAISGGEVVAVARTFKELAEHMKGKVVGGRAIVMKVGEHEPGRVVRGWWSGFL